MITFIAISVVICCALVIAFGLVLSSILYDIRDDIKCIKGYVDEINRELPYNQWFVNTYRNLNKKLDDVNDHLTTEIACLATKNNEDIKRMGGKFEEWDLIKLDENEVLIYSAKPNANGQMVFHCVDKAGKTYTFFGSDKLNDAKFLRHTDSPFEEESK